MVQWTCKYVAWKNFAQKIICMAKNALWFKYPIYTLHTHQLGYYLVLLLSLGGTLQKVGRSVDKTVFCVKSNNFFFFVKPIYAIVECGLLIRIMYAWVRKIILNLLTIVIRIYNIRPNPSALTNTFFKKTIFFFLWQFFCFQPKSS